MSEATHPWWASVPEPPGAGGGRDEAIDDADPVEAFRTARRPHPVPPRAARGGARRNEEPHPRPEPEPETDRGEAGAGQAWQRDQPSPHRPELCGICPLCTLARTLEDTRPELLDHLTEAARHLAAAARSLLDAAPTTPGPTTPGPTTPGPTTPGPTTSSWSPDDHAGTGRRRGEVQRIALDPHGGGDADPDRGGAT